MRDFERNYRALGHFQRILELIAEILHEDRTPLFEHTSPFDLEAFQARMLENDYLLGQLRSALKKIEHGCTFPIPSNFFPEFQHALRRARVLETEILDDRHRIGRLIHPFDSSDPFRAEPPELGHAMIRWMLPFHEAEQLIGDLEMQFDIWVEEHGPAEAKWLYYKEVVLAVIGPLAHSRLARFLERVGLVVILKKLGLLGVLEKLGFEFISKISGS